jgi:hypothetical protein
VCHLGSGHLCNSACLSRSLTHTLPSLFSPFSSPPCRPFILAANPWSVTCHTHFPLVIFCSSVEVSIWRWSWYQHQHWQMWVQEQQQEQEEDLARMVQGLVLVPVEEVCNGFLCVVRWCNQLIRNISSHCTQTKMIYVSHEWILSNTIKCNHLTLLG